MGSIVSQFKILSLLSGEQLQGSTAENVFYKKLLNDNWFT